MSKMLYNPVKLQGIAPKIGKLATREGEISLQTDTNQPPISVVPQARRVSEPGVLQRVSTGQEVGLVALSDDNSGRHIGSLYPFRN